MSETLAPLWSKSRIHTVTHSYSTYIVADNIRCMSEAGAFILMMEMCKDYEAERQRLSADHAALVARIAELEAQLAAARRWEPLPDGRYGGESPDGSDDWWIRISNNGDTLEQWSSSDDERVEIGSLSFFNMKVCRPVYRRVAGEGEGGNG